MTREDSNLWNRIEVLAKEWHDATLEAELKAGEMLLEMLRKSKSPANETDVGSRLAASKFTTFAIWTAPKFKTWWAKHLSKISLYNQGNTWLKDGR